MHVQFSPPYMALTPLGEWLIHVHDLHGVSFRVTEQAWLALALVAFYPTIDLIMSLMLCVLLRYNLLLPIVYMEEVWPSNDLIVSI